MALHKQPLKVISLGPGHNRYRVIITDDPCPADSAEGKLRQTLFLQALVETPSLLHCGYNLFQRLVVSHNGTAWEAIAEAEVEEDVE